MKLISLCLTSLWTSDLSILQLTAYYDWSQRFKMRYITLNLSMKKKTGNVLNKYYVQLPVYLYHSIKLFKEKLFNWVAANISKCWKPAASCYIYPHISNTTYTCININTCTGTCINKFLLDATYINIFLPDATYIYICINISSCINRFLPDAIYINIYTYINISLPDATYMYINVSSCINIHVLNLYSDATSITYLCLPDAT